MNSLLPSFIIEQNQAGETTGKLQAYTMFVDLSGFTPLTEELMKQGTEGADRLRQLLDDIFEPLVGLVYARGGFIPYFAGDAFTAIFPSQEEDGPSARDLIETAAMARDLFIKRESRFDKFTIGIKTGLSFGEVQWGIVGDRNKAFYFRGAPIDRCAHCQTLAGDQHIVLDEVLREQLVQKHFMLEEVDVNAYRVLGKISVPDEAPTPIQLPEVDRQHLSAFYSDAVIEYGEIGEFRTVVSIFISFEGLEEHKPLNRFATIVLDQIHTFSGYFKEIDFGDKGGVITCFFGAPITFENNVSRALEFILSVREEVRQLRKRLGFNFRVGMSVGTAYTGTIGGRERSQYACVGNHVNLAARIMTIAAWGEILVDEEIQKNKNFRFLHKGDIKYKGIAGNIPTYKLSGRDYIDKPGYHSRLIERESELEKLTQFLKPLQKEEAAGLAYIYGEAGVGKSHLTYELRKRIQEKMQVGWYIAQSDQILRKPFNPFIYFLRSYFEQSPDKTEASNRSDFEARFRQLEENLQKQEGIVANRVQRELVRTREILAILVGVPYQDSLWEQLDARGRYQNTIAAIINVLSAESLIRPLVLELEDAHWIDDSSAELIRELPRILQSRSLALIVTARYGDHGEKSYVLEPEILKEAGLACLEVDLNNLPPTAVRTMANDLLQGEISEEFFELLQRTTNANPFYLEQVLEYFIESNLITNENGLWTIKDNNIKLSNSINAILTARIDRLSNLVRDTVKAAAVIGREFEIPILREVLREQEKFRGNDTELAHSLKDRISQAERGQIWMAMNELRYIFRHSLLREAVYGMQLGTQLQHLHQLIAEAIEKLHEDHLAERYVDLAFHYDRAGVFDKTCLYLRKAADYARANYQNQLALDFYEKLLLKLGKQADTVDQIKTNLKKGKVLELIGQWDESLAAYNRALNLAKKSRDVLLLGQTNDALGHLLTLQGEYNDAMHHLQAAAGLFDSIEDNVGIAKAYGHIGNLHLRHGEYDQAQHFFEKSLATGYARRGTAGSAQIVANMGLTYMNLGKYDKGIEAIRSQLEVTRKQGDKQGLATLYTNLGIVYSEKGDYKQALEAYREGLALAEELGNIQLVSIATGCIGSVYQYQGDYDIAMEHFERDLELSEQLGDKQGIAIALGLIGELLSVRGDFHKAIEYLQKNLMLCEELNYQKGIAKAVNTLGDVFYYVEQYERSLSFYNRAIEGARKIDNKLVLGNSLVEKGAVLLATGDLDALQKVVDDAITTAEELANPELLFQAYLLKVNALHRQGAKEQALQQLDTLAAGDDLQAEQKADIAFTRYQINPENTQARNTAADLYTALFKATPNFIYRQRLETLGAMAEG